MKNLIPFILLLALTMITCSDEDKDPCEGVICQNNGECKSGACDCPNNYEGASCQNQVTPEKMFITKIVATGFPATDNSGGGWDLTDGADIYPLIKAASGVIYNSPNYFNNASPTGSYDFVPATSIEISPLIQYTISLYDYDEADPSGDDDLGGVIFLPYSNTGGFPEIITLAPAGGKVTFKIHVTYTW